MKKNEINKREKYLTDNFLTSKVKNYAIEILNSDLVGIANIERFKNAPLMMSPQGIMPSAKSVIVMAVHHPDAIIELDGQEHPQKHGPYGIQYNGMNYRLDEMSYRMSIFIENQGFKAVPIASSNIWRYKGYKELKEHFAPDISHMHAAVAAGLAEFGYNGLAITPEFGPRVRYVTVITDAILTPTPLIEPGTLCDNCKLCATHCLSGALKKELNGWNIVRIEDKEYKYVKKNLWRCAWGEHFDLSLDLPIPERVNEEVIIENVKKYGLTQGEMGSCLRYCLPANIRYWDRKYSNAPRRKKHFIANPEISFFHRGLFEKIRSIASKWCIDAVLINDDTSFSETAISVKNHFLPDAMSAISLVIKDSNSYLKSDFAFTHKTHMQTYMTQSASYDIIRELERYGYDSITNCNWGNAPKEYHFPDEKIAEIIKNQNDNSKYIVHTIITNAKLPITGLRLAKENEILSHTPEELLNIIKNRLSELECNIVGVTSAERLKDVADQIRPYYENETEFIVKDKAKRFYDFDPEVTQRQRKIYSAEDHLPNAKSVIVIGLKIPSETINITPKTPAEAVGPYAFIQYEIQVRLFILAWSVKQILEEHGFKSVISYDLTGLGSYVGNPRGEQPDIFSNAITAVAAGLGRIGKCGFVINPTFRANLRFIAVITDSPLPANKVLTNDDMPLICSKCSYSEIKCPTKAFSDEVNFSIDGVLSQFRKVEVNRCNWAKRYSLSAEEGNKYMGWQLDLPVPENINENALAEGVKKHPTISKYRPCNFEKCFIECPYSG